MQEKQFKRLYRSRTNRIIFGFCGGLGEYFGIDPVLVRIAYVLLMLGTVAGPTLLVLYLVTPLFVQLEPQEKS